MSSKKKNLEEIFAKVPALVEEARKLLEGQTETNRAELALIKEKQQAVFKLLNGQKTPRELSELKNSISRISRRDADLEVAEKNRAAEVQGMTVADKPNKNLVRVPEMEVNMADFGPRSKEVPPPQEEKVA